MRRKVVGIVPPKPPYYGKSEYKLECGHIGLGSARWVAGQLVDPKTINCRECDKP